MFSTRQEQEQKKEGDLKHDDLVKRVLRKVVNMRQTYVKFPLQTRNNFKTSADGY